MGLILLAGLSNISPLTSAQFGITLFLGHPSHSRSQHQCLVGAHSLLNSSSTLYHMPSDNSLLPISAVHSYPSNILFFGHFSHSSISNTCSLGIHFFLHPLFPLFSIHPVGIPSFLRSSFIFFLFKHLPNHFFPLLLNSSSSNTYPILPSPTLYTLPPTTLTSP